MQESQERWGGALERSKHILLLAIPHGNIEGKGGSASGLTFQRDTTTHVFDDFFGYRQT